MRAFLATRAIDGPTGPGRAIRPAHHAEPMRRRGWARRGIGPPRRVEVRADSLDAVAALKGRLAEMPKASARDLAKRDGRATVAGDDVFRALDDLGLSAIFPAAGPVG